MKQPIRKRGTNSTKKKRSASNVKSVRKKFANHQKFGTSKLEEDFARDFLDKLGIEYIYQYEAKDIGRFYDFKIINGPIIEIQGGYWHGDPRLYEEKDLNKVQMKTRRVDEYKQKWALMHGIPIYYIWEKDIRENPKKVLDELKKILYIEEKKRVLTEKKNKRHVNKIK